MLVLRKQLRPHEQPPPYEATASVARRLHRDIGDSADSVMWLTRRTRSRHLRRWFLAAAAVGDDREVPTKRDGSAATPPARPQAKPSAAPLGTTAAANTNGKKATASPTAQRPRFVVGRIVIRGRRPTGDRGCSAPTLTWSPTSSQPEHRPRRSRLPRAVRPVGTQAPPPHEASASVPRLPSAGIGIARIARCGKRVGARDEDDPAQRAPELERRTAGATISTRCAGPLRGAQYLLLLRSR